MRAFVVAPEVVVIDEGGYLLAEITRQEIAFQQDGVLQGLVPPLNFALVLWVIRGTADVIHLPVFQTIGQFARDVTGKVCALGHISEFHFGTSRLV